jgi:hypothetical protein
MRPVLLAIGIFLIGLALIGAIPQADLVPGGVRTVLQDVASIW